MRESFLGGGRRASSRAVAGLLSLGALSLAEEGCATMPQRDPVSVEQTRFREYVAARSALTVFRTPGMPGVLSRLGFEVEPTTPEGQAIFHLREAAGELAPYLPRFQGQDADSAVEDASHLSADRDPDMMRHLVESVQGLRSLDDASRQRLVGVLYRLLREDPDLSVGAIRTLADEALRGSDERIQRALRTETLTGRSVISLYLTPDEIPMAEEILQRFGTTSGNGSSFRTVSYREAHLLRAGSFTSTGQMVVGRITREHAEARNGTVQRLALRVGLRATAGILQEIQAVEGTDR